MPLTARAGDLEEREPPPERIIVRRPQSPANNGYRREMP
jgi:hypothetical protein